MSESEERNKRLMAEAEQIETESREVAEEAWAEVDPRAVQLASDIRSVVEEVRRLREALEYLVAGGLDLHVGEVALAGKASE